MRHRVLVGARQPDLARQPVQQERLDLGRADPQRPAEVPVAAVVHDVVGASAGRLPVRQVLRVIGGEELRDQHGPAVLAPLLAPRGRRDRRAGALAGHGAAPRRRQRPDARPDKSVIGGERRAHRGFCGLFGGSEPGGEDPARLGRVDLRERRAAPAAVPAVVQQLGHLRGHPAVAGQAAGVVVDHDHQRVLFLAGVAERAHDLVAVAVGIGVHIAVAGLDGSDVLGPRRPGHALVHQRQRGPLGLRGLPRRAQAGDA